MMEVMDAAHGTSRLSEKTSRALRLRERWDRLPLLMVLVLYTVVVLRCAWISDDAYITFRTVDNFAAGYGLTWNTAERVQAFTHPLWALLLSATYMLTREIHVTTLALSAGLSALAVLLYAAALAPTPLTATVGVTIFLMSKSFVDYSTSGLENPLSHLLLALYLLVLLRRAPSNGRLFILALLGGLVTLNRMDLVLLVLPGLLVAWYQRRGIRAAGTLLLGFAPFLLWEAFSLFYYGFLFPNTAYAKLNTDLPAGALIRQGLCYLLSSLNMDPLTPLILATGLLLPFIIRQRRCMPVSVGIALYLVYVVAVGADFMAGRFLTAPLLCAVVVLSRSPAARSPRALLIVLALVIITGLASPHPPPLSTDRYGANERYIDAHGVGDERAFYYPATGLLLAVRGAPVPDHSWAWIGRDVRRESPAVYVAQNVGFLGFEAGPAVHIVDLYALAEPLLARLPYRATADWRIGHFRRSLPEGYLETLRGGQNVIADRRIASLYDALALITRGRLLDPQRLAAIVRLNTGLEL